METNCAADALNQKVGIFEPAKERQFEDYAGDQPAMRGGLPAGMGENRSSR